MFGAILLCIHVSDCIHAVELNDKTPHLKNHQFLNAFPSIPWLIINSMHNHKILSGRKFGFDY